MDFTLSEDQQAIVALAGTLLADHCPPEVLRKLDAAGAGGVVAPAAWAALAEADLVGLALPERDGGAGRGVLEACLVAEQVGRHVAPVPYWPTVAAARAVARWGDERQRARWLPGALDGSGPLAVALWEPAATGAPGPALHPTTVAVPEGGGWRLTGTRAPVPWAATAAAVVVPAVVAPGPGEGVGLFVVEPDGPGVAAVDEQVVSREPYRTLVLDGARVGPEARLGPPGQEQVRGLAAWATALLAATALGVAEGALALTAAHVSTREQFGAPIGTFQAVAHRCADAYVDTEAMRLTTWRAAWLLDATEGWPAGGPPGEGPPAAGPGGAGPPGDGPEGGGTGDGGPGGDEAAGGGPGAPWGGDAGSGAGLGADPGEALDVAAFWVAEGGQRVVHAAQHLHGGLGMDVDYPLHRYFRWAKVLELLVGGAPGALLRLGATLADRE